MNPVEAYRGAAKRLFGISDVEAEVYIRDPKDAHGWADDALVVIFTEADCRREGDDGVLPDLLDYYGKGHENFERLSKAAGVGFIEPINAAVAAVVSL